MVKLYHYTTEAGKEGIENPASGRPTIFASTPRNRNYPRGVYFTDLPPTTDSTLLIINNYDDGGRPGFIENHENFIKWYIEVDEEEVPGVRKLNNVGERNIWMTEQDVVLNEKYIWQVKKDKKKTSFSLSCIGEKPS